MDKGIDILIGFDLVCREVIVDSIALTSVRLSYHRKPLPVWVFAALEHLSILLLLLYPNRRDYRCSRLLWVAVVVSRSRGGRRTSLTFRMLMHRCVGRTRGWWSSAASQLHRLADQPIDPQGLSMLKLRCLTCDTRSTLFTFKSTARTSTL